MASHSTRAAKRIEPELGKKFHLLAESWKKNTKFLSSVTAMAMDQSYQRIIGMGPAVLPLIFAELKKKPEHWFWALKAITGEDPVPLEDAGDIERMREAWLRYGEEQGLI